MYPQAFRNRYHLKEEKISIILIHNSIKIFNIICYNDGLKSVTMATDEWSFHSEMLVT